MNKNVLMKSCVQKEIKCIDHYTKVSEQDAKCIIKSVQKMYKDNNILLNIKNCICQKKSPHISVIISEKGILFRIGMDCRVTKISTLTPKGRGK